MLQNTPFLAALPRGCNEQIETKVQKELQFAEIVISL